MPPAVAHPSDKVMCGTGGSSGEQLILLACESFVLLSWAKGFEEFFTTAKQRHTGSDPRIKYSGEGGSLPFERKTFLGPVPLFQRT